MPELIVINARKFGGKKLLPAIIHLHAGGGCLGNAAWDLTFMSNITTDNEVVGIGVDYRLTPTH